MLQFAHQNGCAWTSWTCETAARGGHLAVLQYAHQNGCAWGQGACAAAARGGHLKVLQYARQNSCEWGPLWIDLTSCLQVSPALLVYLVQQQAPLSVSHLAQARTAATQMTYAVLSLRAALPDTTPHESVLRIVTLAFSEPRRMNLC